jgi:chromate transporter
LIKEVERGVGGVTLGALFSAFLQISLCAFGGPMLWVRRMVVDKRGWLDDREFAEMLAFCQFLPGPNVVSLVVCVGARFRGLAGALAGLAGFIVIPWTLGFAIGALALRYAELGLLQHVLRGIAAAAAGLIIGTALRLLRPYRAKPAALLFAALAFVGLAVAHLPLLVVVAALVPLGIAAAGAGGGRDRQPAPSAT